MGESRVKGTKFNQLLFVVGHRNKTVEIFVSPGNTFIFLNYNLLFK